MQGKLGESGRGTNAVDLETGWENYEVLKVKNCMTQNCGCQIQEDLGNPNKSLVALMKVVFQYYFEKTVCFFEGTTQGSITAIVARC